MAQLRLILQEPQLEESEPTTVLSYFLTVQMDGLDTPIRRRKTLQERLGFKGMGCCGATWGGFRPSTIDDEDQEQETPQPQLQREQNQDQVVRIIDLGESTPERPSDLDCVALSPASSGMNLAAALAAERHLRGSHEPEEESRVGVGVSSAPGTPLRMSLLRLLAETTDGGGGEGAEEGSDMVCCVCMGRKKGAAFIPCGHTFCRVCSRELWLNRGCCPICNRQILEILDIF